MFTDVSGRINRSRYILTNINLAVNCVELGCRCFSFGNQHIVPALDLTLSLQVPAHCHDGAVGL